MMIRELKEHEFDDVFSIMESSFPEDEYRPYEEQKALLQKENYVIYVMEDSDRQSIKAFIAVWLLEDFAFVEHFAVNPDYRNQGLGASILKEVKEQLKRQICLEVELPETEFAARRIAFYERNGFMFHAYSYMQPAISKGRQPIPLRIMTSEKHISLERFQEIKTILYRDVYRFCEEE